MSNKKCSDLEILENNCDENERSLGTHRGSICVSIFVETQYCCEKELRRQAHFLLVYFNVCSLHKI